MDTLSLTKEARIYNGEKTVSLTSGAGKTGQPLVKECSLVDGRIVERSADGQVSIKSHEGQ